MFSFLKSEIALHGTNQQYIVLYNQGIQSLTNHLKKLAGIISTENAERILALLDYYVFQEEHQWLDIPSLHKLLKNHKQHRKRSVQKPIPTTIH